MSATSVLQRVYDRSLAAVGSDQQYLVYSYLNDFARLWELDGELELNPGQPIQLIVVWDGMPPKTHAPGVDTSSYLTAFDWAVAFSIKIYDKYKNQVTRGESDPVRPNVQITVIDEMSGGFESSNAVRFFNQIPKRNWLTLPWLNIYQPRGERKRTDSSVEFLSRIGYLPAGVSTPGAGDDRCSFSEAVKTGACNDSTMNIVRQTWTGMLLSPNENDDHHAVSNLIGPIAFLGPRECLHEKTMVKLLTWLGCYGAVDEVETVNWGRGKIKRRLRNCRKLYNKLNILLIDDCANKHRWGEVLRRFLVMEEMQKVSVYPGTKSVGRRAVEKTNLFLHSMDDAGSLLNSLLFSFNSDQPEKNLNPIVQINHRQIAFGGEERNEFVDLLVLDLRLQQGDNLRDEIKFFRNVHAAASVCQKAITGFRLSFTALSEAEEWLDAGESEINRVSRNDTGYVKCLTLFARLVASLDESLPIILFSSTSRGDILKTLEKHPNIYSQWSKPNVHPTRFWASVKHSAKAFESVFEEALKLLPARLLTRRLTADRQNDFDDQWSVKSDCIGTIEEPWTIDLMVDEVGTADAFIENINQRQKHLRVAGFLCISPPGKSITPVEEILQSFDKDLFSKHELRTNLESLLVKVLDESERQHLSVFPISVGGDFGNALNTFKREADLASDESVGDNLFLELFQRIVEVAIFGACKRLIPKGSFVQFNIRAGTRIRYVGSFAALNLKKMGRCRENELEGDILCRLAADSKEYQQMRSNVIEFFRTKWGVGFSQNVKREISVTKQPEDPLPMRVARHQNPRKIWFDDDRVYFFGEDTPRFLAQSVWQHYKMDIDHRINSNVVRAYLMNSQNTDTLRFHLLADALISEWLWKSKPNTAFESSPILKNWIRDGAISDTYDKCLVCFLQAQRYLSQGMPANALAKIMSLPTVKVDVDRRGVGMMLAALQDAASRLRGLEFQQLADAVDSSHDSLGMRNLRGTVHFIGDKWIVRCGMTDFVVNQDYVKNLGLKEGALVKFQMTNDVASQLPIVTKLESTSFSS